MTPPSDSTPRRDPWILDTNVVLEWLLFQDPCCAALARAVVSGRARWIASAAMRAELEHVLGRDVGRGRGRAPAAVLDDWQRWATIVEPSDQPSPRALRCSDADDQKFVDLAWQVRASTLVSRDRAVLKLARRASLHGFAIVSTPASAARLEALPAHASAAPAHVPPPTEPTVRPPLDGP